MRRSTLAIVLAALIVVSGVSGYLGGFYTPRVMTQGATTTTTNPSIRITTTRTSNSVSCTVSGPTEGVIIQVVEGSNQTPISGAVVKGEDVGYCNYNSTPQTIVFNETTTNGTGWAKVLYGGFGTYYLDVLISPYQNYALSLSLPTQPLSATIAVFNVSTGNVTTHYCYLLQSCNGS